MKLVKTNSKKGSLKKAVIARSSQELASALGLPSEVAVEWDFRHQLTEKIIRLFERQNITHQHLAERAETSRPNITKILNRRLSNVSTDLLIRVLAALGYGLNISIKRIA